MCEVCKAEGADWKFRNGPNKEIIYQNSLYKVYQDSVANIRLCYIHSVELFMDGEKKFLKAHLIFARELAKRSRRYEKEETSPFGF